MDTMKQKVIVVGLQTSESFKFVKYSNGLYFFDTDSLSYNTKTKIRFNDYVVAQTVSTNKEYFMVNKIKGVDKSTRGTKISYISTPKDHFISYATLYRTFLKHIG